MPSELLTEREVSLQYKLSIPWLRRARREHRGPSFIKVSRMVRYKRSEVEKYLTDRVVESKEPSPRMQPK